VGSRPLHYGCGRRSSSSTSGWSGGPPSKDIPKKLDGCYPLEDDNAEGNPPVYAVDVTSWPRCDAEASPERGYYYHPSIHSAGQPVVAGWACQLIAQIGFTRDTWVAPVDVRRVHPAEDPNDVAAEQVKGLLRRLPHSTAAVPSPLFVIDAGYDPVALQKHLEDSGVQLLVRLQSNRVFYALQCGSATSACLLEVTNGSSGERFLEARARRSQPVYVALDQCTAALAPHPSETLDAGLAPRSMRGESDLLFADNLLQDGRALAAIQPVGVAEQAHPPT
jgi:hypothetical protein